jgi:hypothetical protein
MEAAMSLELINSVAAAGTFVVIGATAIAAVIQLRHLRASNQLQGLLTVLDRVEDSNFNQWVDDARRTLEKNLPDPAYRRGILDGTFERANNPWLNLGNSYEWVGSLVRQRLIAEGPFMDVYSWRVIRAWKIMEDVVAVIRCANPAVWENFEYHAAASVSALCSRRALYGATHPRHVSADHAASEAARQVASRGQRGIIATSLIPADFICSPWDFSDTAAWIQTFSTWRGNHRSAAAKPAGQRQR